MVKGSASGYTICRLKLKYKAINETMDIPLTFLCNNNCISCIIDSRLSSMRGQMDWSEIKGRIDRLPDSCDTVGITGGEPTISVHFFRAMKYLREKKPGLMTFLVSNGRMFSYNKFCDRFSSVGLERVRVGIALYSHDPHIHDSITMSPGSCKQTVEGIRNLFKMRIAVELRLIVNRKNYRQLADTADFIKQCLPGVERVVFINMKYTGNAFKNREELFIRYSDIVPHVIRAAETLESSGIETRLFHFPLCTIPERHHEKAMGITKQRAELAYAERCGECSKKEECPMIWKTYLVLAGEKEFSPL